MPKLCGLVAMLALAGCASTVADITFADGSRVRLNSTRLFTTSSFHIDPVTKGIDASSDAEAPDLPKLPEQVSLLNGNLAMLLTFLQGLVTKEPAK